MLLVFSIYYLGLCKVKIIEFFKFMGFLGFKGLVFPKVLGFPNFV